MERQLLMDGTFTDSDTGAYGETTWQFANANRSGYSSLGDMVSASSDLPAKGSFAYSVCVCNHSHLYFIICS